jgi:phosphatidylglycerophosphate synthase
MSEKNFVGENPKSSTSPVVVARAVIVSLKRRAFSKKQSLCQKIVIFCLFVIISSVGNAYMGAMGILTALAFCIILRWINLKVFAPKDNLMFLMAGLYVLTLYSFSFLYGVLYKYVLREITAIKFFPEFPFNQQTVTESATAKEMLARDEFWRKKVSQRSPSPNFLTISRFVGSVVLFFFLDLAPEWFFSLAIILFLSDYFDGIIARTQGRETLFGKWADPIADRILITLVTSYLYIMDPIFWNPIIVMIIIPELVLGTFFLVIFTISKKMEVPRPVVWGRVKFSLYFCGVLSFLLSSLSLSGLLFLAGSLFAWVALVSYLTRSYQESQMESIFNGILKWSMKSKRIQVELSGYSS